MKQSLTIYIEQLMEGRDLSPRDASLAMTTLMSGKVKEAEQAAFLTALQIKQVNARELASFAFRLRSMARQIPTRQIKEVSILGDTCGTGGGTINTFNISTTVMFILAANGITVAKHGNRAITSRCGSADILENLGINIYMEPIKAVVALKEIGISFIFAPLYHQAFKNVQKVRRELGIPTVFNILGPLVNPVFSSLRKQGKKLRQPQVIQLLGVNQPQLTPMLAQALKLLGASRAMVVYGYDREAKRGMDEISTLGKTKVSELTLEGRIKNYFIDPRDFGLRLVHPEELSGKTIKGNSKILTDILTGKEKGAKRDIVVFNAAAGLYLGGKAGDLKEALNLAKETIDSGKALEKLELLRQYSR
ncbi:MAG: anthranilate phosphoribosyltransferase [Candidatus Omnitrophica bacterium]|nr:anthranilate phosphoribosyltransferase [Candidatus Omnitrophota bacterium]